MLTAKQMRLFNFISQHLHNTGKSPTYATIVKELDMAGPAVVFHMVNRLCDKGYLHRDKNVAQSITIVKYPPGATKPTTDNDIFNPEQDARDRMAYARGVAAERARLQAQPDLVQAQAVKKAYDKGFADGKTYRNRAKADDFARGLAAGKAEKTRLLSRAYEDGYAQCLADNGLTRAQRRAG
jgi:hypothetical protein